MRTERDRLSLEMIKKLEHIIRKEQPKTLQQECKRRVLTEDLANVSVVINGTSKKDPDVKAVTNPQSIISLCSSEGVKRESTLDQGASSNLSV